MAVKSYVPIDDFLLYQHVSTVFSAIQLLKRKCTCSYYLIAGSTPRMGSTSLAQFWMDTTIRYGKERLMERFMLK